MSYLITIDYTKIDSTLTDFRHLVVFTETNVGASSLAGIVANPLKVSFKLSDETELYAELESYSSTYVRYFISIPTVSSSVNTIITALDGLVSDNSSYVSVIGGTPGQTVWANEVGVWHGVQDPSGGTECIFDSTGGSDGTPGGTMTTGDLISTDHGPALDFDGTDDYIDCGSPGLNSSTCTVSALLNINSTQVTSYVGLFTNTKEGFRMTHSGNKHPLVYASGDYEFTSAADWSGSADDWAVYTFTTDGSNAKFYVDGVLFDTRALTNIVDLSSLDLFRNGFDSNYLKGAGKNFLITDTTWSADYIKAFSLSLLDSLATIYTSYSADILTEEPVFTPVTVQTNDISSGCPLVNNLNVFPVFQPINIISQAPVVDSCDIQYVVKLILDDLLSGIPSVPSLVTIINEGTIITVVLDLPISFNISTGSNIDVTLPSFDLSTNVESGLVADITMSFPSLSYVSNFGSYFTGNVPIPTMLCDLSKVELTTILGQLPSFELSMLGRLASDGDITGMLKALSLSMTFLSGSSIDISGTLPKFEMLLAALTGTIITMSSTLPAMQVDISSIVTGDNDIDITFPGMTSTFEGDKLVCSILSYVKGAVR